MVEQGYLIDRLHVTPSSSRVMTRMDLLEMLAVSRSPV